MRHGFIMVREGCGRAAMSSSHDDTCGAGGALDQATPIQSLLLPGTDELDLTYAIADDADSPPHSAVHTTSAGAEEAKGDGTDPDDAQSPHNDDHLVSNRWLGWTMLPPGLIACMWSMWQPLLMQRLLSAPTLPHVSAAVRARLAGSYRIHPSNRWGHAAHTLLAQASTARMQSMAYRCNRSVASFGR